MAWNKGKSNKHLTKVASAGFEPCSILKLELARCMGMACSQSQRSPSAPQGERFKTVA